MNQKMRVSSPAVGGSSLLVIFAVLCLTVFSLLSLSTVQAEKRLSDASVQAVQAYYEADCQAEAIFARLRSGECPEQVRVQGNDCAYSCPVSESRQLQVLLRCEAGTWTVLHWQTVNTKTQDSESNLPVWDGN